MITLRHLLGRIGHIATLLTTVGVVGIVAVLVLSASARPWSVRSMGRDASATVSGRCRSFGCPSRSASGASVVVPGSRRSDMVGAFRWLACCEGPYPRPPGARHRTPVRQPIVICTD